MGRPDARPAAPRSRREPPRFRRVAVRRVEPASPRLSRVTLAGPELAGLSITQPAASVRLLLPSPGETELVMPSWTGNEFLLTDGRRPAIRTFTPRRLDARVLELDLEIVVHGAGVASGWAEAVEPGATAAISGPGRGYVIDAGAAAFLLAGDETAIPAISQLLENLPADVPVEVHVEVAHPDARLALPHRSGTTVDWHDLPPGTPPGDALVTAVRRVDLAPGSRVWVAGEAAAVQRIRRHLFDDQGVPRAHTSLRGYWKHGRTGDGGDD